MQDGKITRSDAGKLGWEKTKKRHEERNRIFRENYEKNPKVCGCGRVLSFEKRRNSSCSQSCAASKRNVGVRRRGGPPRICRGCGDETRNPKFCSNRCQREYGYKTFIEKWLKGEIDGGWGEQVSKSLRRWLKEKSGGQCQICSGTEWMGQPMPLIVDHIDGHSENNRPDNLRVVCGNCDMQLTTYKGRNAGNGRYLRRKRYQEGKSY